jgi:ornithine cyclodeaminase
LFRRIERIFVDTEHALDESGDVIIPVQEGWVPRDQVIPLSSLLYGKTDRPQQGETVLFKSVGMALFDVVVSNTILQNAEAKGLGTLLKLE